MAKRKSGRARGTLGPAQGARRGRTRIEMAAIAVPPVAISGSRRKSVSTVTVAGSFWYCGSRPHVSGGLLASTGKTCVRIRQAGGTPSRGTDPGRRQTPPGTGRAWLRERCPCRQLSCRTHQLGEESARSVMPMPARRMGVRPTRGAMALPVKGAIGLLSCRVDTVRSAGRFARLTEYSNAVGLTPGTSLTGRLRDASMPRTVESSLTRARKRCELVRASRSSESLAWTTGWDRTLTDCARGPGGAGQLVSRGWGGGRARGAP